VVIVGKLVILLLDRLRTSPWSGLALTAQMMV
jgi:hypothetical protein